MTAWTALEDGHLWEKVAERMAWPVGRLYHNMDHNRRLYEVAAALGLPYDYDLDLAILFHDVIYDRGPFKELRSIEFMNELIGSQPGAEYHIQRTIFHRLGGDYRMVLLDLFDLSDPMRNLHNYGKIKLESMALYDCTEIDFAQGNRSFMKIMAYEFTDEKIEANLSGAAHRELFRRIQFGISENIRRSNWLCRFEPPVVEEEWIDVN